MQEKEKFVTNENNINFRRSRFDRSHSHKFTMTSGRAVPFLLEEVLTGDTFSVNTRALVRMLTPVSALSTAVIPVFSRRYSVRTRQLHGPMRLSL